MQDTPVQHKVEETLRLRHPYDPELPENERSFAPYVHETEVARAFGSRDIPKLAALLSSSPSDENISASLSILLDILSTQEEKEVAAKSIITSCTKLLGHADGTIRRKAAEAVGFLALSQSARDEFTVATFSSFINLLKDSASSGIREAAALCVKNITQFSDGCQRLISGETYVDTICAAACDGFAGDSPASPDVVYYLISAIVSITHHTYGVERLLQNDTAVDQILDAFAFARPGLERKCLNALWNITQTLEGKERTIKAVGKICEYLNREGHVLRCALGALHGIVINEKGKRSLAEASKETLECICAALYHSDGGISTNASNCILAASEYLPAKERFVSMIMKDCEMLLKVLGTGCCKQIVKYLADEDAQRRFWACKAAKQLAGENDAFLGCLHSVERLAALLGDADEGCKACAESVLAKLCSVNRSAAKRVRKYIATRASFSVQKAFSNTSILCD